MPESGNERLTTSSIVTRPVVEAKLESRTYSPSPRATSPAEVIGKPPVELRTVAEYQQWNKQPYATEYFGLANLPTYAKSIEQIDSYVQAELRSRNFDDSLDNYRSILDELAGSMGLSPRENSSARLSKMARWIARVLIPQQQINERKLKILGNA